MYVMFFYDACFLVGLVSTLAHYMGWNGSYLIGEGGDLLL